MSVRKLLINRWRRTWGTLRHHMTPQESRALIDACGGNRAFAIQLGIDLAVDPNYMYRVGMWKIRGIPPKIQISKAKEIATLKLSAIRRGVL